MIKGPFSFLVAHQYPSSTHQLQREEYFLNIVREIEGVALSSGMALCFLLVRKVLPTFEWFVQGFHHSIIYFPLLKMLCRLLSLCVAMIKKTVSLNAQEQNLFLQIMITQTQYLSYTDLSVVLRVPKLSGSR